MSEDGGGKQLGTLASITAAIEATRTEIKSIGIQTGTDTYEARVRLAIPLDRVTSLDRARINADDAAFVGDDLQFELTIEIDGVDQTDLGAPRAVSEALTETEGPPDSTTEVADGTETGAHSTTQPGDGESRNDDTEGTETPPTVEAESDSGTEPDTQNTSDTDTHGELPEYQDPERLAAVYDEDATFEEMRRKLDVDVTAQTVRKYMIKHGIHEPEPRPDRLLETIRASELELMNSDEDRRASQTDDATDSDGGS